KAQAVFASEPVALNGDLSKWEDCDPIVIDKAVQVQEGSFLWKGPMDLSARVYVKWDDKNLYLAADVNDSKPFINYNKKGGIWNGDAVEIALGVAGGAGINRSSMEESDFQIGISPGNKKDIPASVWIWKNNAPPAGGEVFVKAKSKGYVIEARIPWENFGTFKPKNGTRIGFDFALDDADAKNKREVQMVWNGDFLFYKDPGVWGELEFVK
ncbi:MAG: sugar-binding protein, partial [Candidatus Margulisiibacteriota bacterium]